VAEKLGIDLIWFGVLLGVNMQTSFMHPPFGFALFYLRSVAPSRDYLDKVTGRIMAPVKTGHIYWGAVPFVLIQLVMVGLVISFPQMVMVYKSGDAPADPNKARIEIPTLESTEKPDDIMKDLLKGSGPVPDPGAPKAPPENAIERAMQGATDDAKADAKSKAGAPKAKTPEEKAAEEIEKALMGTK
jgi:hypothetical protein